MRCALFCAKLPIVVVVVGVVGKSIYCKCCLMQMQCKTAKLLQVEWHRLRAIVSRKKRKMERKKDIRSSTDTWQQNAKRKYKKKKILVSKVADIIAKVRQLTTCLVPRTSPLQLGLWQFYWMKCLEERASKQVQPVVCFYYHHLSEMLPLLCTVSCIKILYKNTEIFHVFFLVSGVRKKTT